MNNRAARWLALLICSLNVAMSIASVVLAALNGADVVDLFDAGPILGVSFSIMGALIAVHRRTNPIGWIFLAIGCSQGLVAFSYDYAIYALITQPSSLWGGAAMSWLGSLAWIPGLHLLLTYGLLLFPDGRLPSPRWRLVAWACVLPLLIFVPVAIAAWPQQGRAMLEHPEQAEPTGTIGILGPLIFPLMLVCGLACVISLVVRFRRSRGIERQQLKWVTYAAAMTFTVIVVSNSIINRDSLWTLLFVPVIPSIPLAAGIAVLRYRLYDIDLIINRTLVYGILTGLLVAIYFGNVVLLQRLLTPLIGGNDQIAIVASTLAIAALFNPLRRRIQTTIDRRFYRRRYDAQKTLQAFSVKLRDEVDLGQLSADLLQVVQDTLQPAQVSCGSANLLVMDNVNARPLPSKEFR